MKTIGLLGGMSWESTQTYYQLINQTVNERLGRLHSAKIILFSVDFELIEAYQQNGNWQAAGDLLTDAAKKLEAAGADCLLICSNTMHKVFHQVQNNISMPLFHIADASAQRITDDGFSKVALLGTSFTMQEAFYKQRIADNYAIEVIVPDRQEQAFVHNVIYQELCLGRIEAESRIGFSAIIDRLKHQGAQAVILGCTEIGMLVSAKSSSLPVYDTAELHALCAVEYALNEA